MRAGMAGQGVSSQTLLLPEVVEIDEAGCDRLEARAEELAELGLQLERFGPRAMLVRGVPGPLGQSEVPGLIADPADELGAYDDAPSLNDRKAPVANRLACPGSCRAGRGLGGAGGATGTG